jgi:hypothetical protein
MATRKRRGLSSWRTKGAAACRAVTHVATSARLRSPSLASSFATWCSTVRVERCQAAAMARSLQPAASPGGRPSSMSSSGPSGVGDSSGSHQPTSQSSWAGALLRAARSRLVLPTPASPCSSRQRPPAPGAASDCSQCASVASGMSRSISAGVSAAARSCIPTPSSSGAS